MDADAPRDAFAMFDQLDDPRGPSRWHRLDELLLITILAVICGAQNWADVELFGKSKHKWLATFLKLPHGIASHDTFGRVFAALDPEQLERCFIQWTAAPARAGHGERVAIDGKTLRRSFDTARAIRDADAHYLMQVKANPRSLHQDVKLFFDQAIAHGWQHTGHAFHETIDKDHGRIERRRCWSTWGIGWLKRRNQDAPWPDLAAENFSRVCRLTTNLLRRDTTTKAGINARRKRAGWDHQLRLHLIQLA